MLEGFELMDYSLLVWPTQPWSQFY